MEMGKGYAFVNTQNDSDSWIISFIAFQLIVHPDIHIHLPDILMRYLLISLAFIGYAPILSFFDIFSVYFNF